ncbi:MAG: hypothetical protein AAGG07_02365 [Planctomycetota bacterium]
MTTDRNTHEGRGRLATGPASTALLAVIAGLLAVDVLSPRTGEGTSPLVAFESVAHAEQPSGSNGGALISAGEQRKMMIAELRQMRGKVDALEKRLASGLQVKVTDMPEQKQRDRDE